MKKKIFIITVGALFILVFLLLLNNKPTVEKDLEKISVVTTLFPFYDFVKNIGQDKVSVLLLLPPGVDAHSFEPKPSDIIKINEADVFVYTGEFMEPWAENIIKGITNKDIAIVNASQGVELIEGEHDDEHGDEHEGMDPHIWLDFDNNKKIVDNILEVLITKDPLNAEFYQNNALDYKNKLEQLDDQYKLTLAQCERQEIIYGGHYAFGYLSKRYNLNYHSAYGVSPNAEPLAKDLVRLIEQIKKEKISYIFFEELVNPKVAEVLSKEAGVGLLLLNPVGNITKEDLQNNVSFISIMENNLINLKTGLICN